MQQAARQQYIILRQDKKRYMKVINLSGRGSIFGFRGFRIPIQHGGSTFLSD
jgi:hypothetical protein